MVIKGYVVILISDICDVCGLVFSFIYWYFGFKEGVLVVMMECGVQCFFVVIFIWDEVYGFVEQ